MSDLFTVSVWRRLAGAALLAAAAWGGVWAVEHAYAARRPASVPQPAAGSRVIALTCTASRAVARWRVAIDGAVVEIQAIAGQADEGRWVGSLPAPLTRCELVVEADPGRPGTTALRVQVDTGAAPIERTAWADGLARVTLLLPAQR